MRELPLPLVVSDSEVLDAGNGRCGARPGDGKIKSVRQRSLAGKRVHNGCKMEVVT